MTLSNLAGDERTAKELARYRQFLLWTFLAAFFFGIMMLLAFWSFDETRIGFAAAVAFGYSACLLAANAYLRQGRMHAAVMASGYRIPVDADRQRHV